MNLSLDLLMQDYTVIFIMAIVTVIFTIMLRSFLVATLQVLLILSLTILPENVVMIQSIFVAVQAVLSGVVVYKIVKAVDMNYRLVLEKTHQKTPDLINDQQRGSRFSFWNTN